MSDIEIIYPGLDCSFLSFADNFRFEHKIRTVDNRKGKYSKKKLVGNKCLVIYISWLITE